jgi:hypothetical protein
MSLHALVIDLLTVASWLLKMSNQQKKKNKSDSLVVQWRLWEDLVFFIGSS